MIDPFIAPLALALNGRGLRPWLIGGNAIELVLNRDIRAHEDIDLLVALPDAPSAVATITSLGFEQFHGSLERGDVFFRREGLVIDLVPIDDSTDPPRTVGALAGLAWPAGLLEPHALEHEGVEIITLTPAMHLAMKDVVAAFFAIEPRPKDLLDREHLESHLAESHGPEGVVASRA
ncbi:MAG TPA: hypothetical protein VNT60_04790 [Deinococcales bacterium]|nr:hypothetical protein [Deinococcales bacterium]